MKTIDSKTRERRKITQLAGQYRKQGYEVQRQVPVAQGRACADLVVKKSAETIVIEVKTSESLRQHKDELLAMAKFFQDTHEARFDLVITNPRKKAVNHRPKTTKTPQH